MQTSAHNIQKIVIPKPGGFDRLQLQSAPQPAIRPGQVRIAVEAAGVNYADAMVRRGLYRNANKLGFPLTPGFEAAGVVTELGHGVSDLKVGDRVFAVTLFGAYASEIVVDRPFVFALPAGFTAAQAAAFPSVWMTAWFALCELAHPRPGATILVHSAAGGVGGALVQLGKILGATVVGVVGSSHKVEAAKALGCDHVIDKSKQDLWREADRIAPKGFDVVLDANGVATLKDSYKHLAPAGKLVIYGFHTMIPKTKSGRTNWLSLAIDFLRTPRFSPFELTESNHSVMAFNLSDLFDRQDILQTAMRELLGWVASGQIKAPETLSFPFADVGKAHAAIESGQTTGKLVLVPSTVSA